MFTVQGCLYFCGFEAIFHKHSFTPPIKCSRIEKIKSIKCCLSEDLNGDVHWSGPTPIHLGLMIHSCYIHTRDRVEAL